MATQLFCSSCGAGYSDNSAYCPMCGISVSRSAVTAFNRQPQAHCTGCGSKTGPRDTYCAVCGMGCGEYVAQASFGGQVFGGGAGAGSGFASGGFTNVADGVKNFAPNLAQMKDRAVFAPAIIFALVSIVVGIVLSFLIDMLLGNALKQMFYGQIGSLVGYGTLETMSFKLGPITVWLLTCLGGLSGSARSMVFGANEGGSVSLALGFIILAVVPVVSLIIGRAARKAFIGSQHPGKQIRAIDGLCAALIFAVVNAILSFFPSALASSLNQAVAISGTREVIKFSVGTRIVPLFLFSFIVAFILAMPNLKEIASGYVGAKNKAVGLSCAAGASFVRLVLLCGLISAVVMFGYSFIKAGDTGVFNMIGGGSTAKIIIYIVLALVLNCAIWYASLFTGGSLAVRVSGAMTGGVASVITTGALGAKASVAGFYSQSIASWPGGILLLVAGLWIAVTVLYKLLKNEQLNLQTIIGVIAVPAVVMCIISSCASIGGTVSGGGSSGTVMLSSASFGNLIMCAVFMALAVGVVFFAKRMPQLDNIVSKLATTPFACAATAVASLVMCLTMKTSAVGGLDMIEDLFSFL